MTAPVPTSVPSAKPTPGPTEMAQAAAAGVSVSAIIEFDDRALAAVYRNGKTEVLLIVPDGAEWKATTLVSVPETFDPAGLYASMHVATCDALSGRPVVFGLYTDPNEPVFRMEKAPGVGGDNSSGAWLFVLPTGLPVATTFEVWGTEIHPMFTGRSLAPTDACSP